VLSLPSSVDAQNVVVGIEEHPAVWKGAGGSLRVVFPPETGIDVILAERIEAVLRTLMRDRPIRPEGLIVGLSPDLGVNEARAVPEARAIVLNQMRSSHWSDQELATVLAHELAHLDNATRWRGQHVPAWFSEGMATLHSPGLDCNARVRLALLASMVREGQAVLTFRPEGRLSRAAYEVAATAALFMEERLGASEVAAWHDLIAAHGWSAAVRSSFGSEAELEEAWRGWFLQRYATFPRCQPAG
jgi:hypothetical protein